MTVKKSRISRSSNNSDGTATWIRRSQFIFSNGIYDLYNHQFRNGRPEDYISMKTSCEYIQYDPSSQDAIELDNFFQDIQPNSDLKEYLLLKLIDGILYLKLSLLIIFL